MNQNALAHFHAALRKQGIVRGHEDFRNRGCFGPIKVRRNFREVALRQGDELGLCAAANDSKNAIANLPPARVCTDLNDFAGEFQPGNLLRVTGRRRIATQALQNIRTIQSCRAHADSHAICGRAGRICDFAHFEAFNAAKGNDCDCFHLERG